MTKTGGDTWEFRARFRRHAFGWKSAPAIQRVRQAVDEIRKAARRDAMHAAEGAVMFLERVSPALEHVDGSSGAIGSTVHHAISELVLIIAEAPADAKTRAKWLERLWSAHEADQMPYIESLADHWGTLCASQPVASEWADRLIDRTRVALGTDRSQHAFFHGTSACLSALFRAERYPEILDLLKARTIWPYRRWAVKALAATGRNSEAIAYAESCRGPWTPDGSVDAICEEILLSSGFAEEAYARYGLRANRGPTYLATFRAVMKKYPHRAAADVLNDLVATTPGEEGKWFAAAKDAGLHDEAIALARRTPCDPRTLTRAARDYSVRQPAFATEAGLLALHWLVQGHGYEITGADVWAAYSNTIKAAEAAGRLAEVRTRVRQLVAAEPPGGFVGKILGPTIAQDIV